MEKIKTFYNANKKMIHIVGGVAVAVLIYFKFIKKK
jgi:hypothetical protein